MQNEKQIKRPNDLIIDLGCGRGGKAHPAEVLDETQGWVGQQKRLL